MKRKIMTPVNTSLQSQLKALETILLKNTALQTIFERAPGLRLPNWYVGAGCITQTVWNYLASRDLLADISDADLVYFKGADLTSETEARRSDAARSFLSDVPIRIDVKNEARVHLWYEKHFGYPIKPYQSIEEAINSWPTTATAVAVRYDDDGSFAVYAHFGMNDLFGMIVRPNKAQITKKIYLAKVKRWKACWPELQIIPW